VIKDTAKRCWFRDELRQARAMAFRDGEGCDEIILTLERLGLVLTKKTINLRGFKQAIRAQASKSPLAEEIPKQFVDVMMPFPLLYDYVVEGRNAAFHEGAYGRHLTTHAVILSTILEDALMNGLNNVRDFMVPNPICAESWQPVSFIRQTMLVNSFSYLPVRMRYGSAEEDWWLISSQAVAQYLRVCPHPRKNLATPLDGAINANGIQPLLPRLASPAHSIEKATHRWDGHPILVMRDGSRELLGILTAFDLL